MTLLEKAARRWDIEPSVRSTLPFADGIALLNVKRIELVCVLGALNNLVELAVGHWRQQLLIDLLLVPVMVALSHALARGGSPRTRRAAVAVFIVGALLITQWAVLKASPRGFVAPGYLIRLLTITLLFVLPPRTLFALLALLFLTYGAMVLNFPLSTYWRVEAMVNAGIVTLVSQMAGWLIYSARLTDHQQLMLIESQNTRLEAQNAELDQLMAITAHDLRSPLYGLRNLFDLASRRAAQQPELPYRALQDGIASLDAMLLLVTRLLQAHQAEHEPLAAAVDDDLREHVSAAARRIAPLAEVHAVTVDVSLPQAALPARFDGGALGQILDNLLANAVRYTPTGRSLRLAAQRVGSEAILVVADSGPGIDPAMRPALFRKFHRGARGPDAREAGHGGKAGSGMGLFIAATYAARIGARLSFRPGEPGGAVFELALRLAEQGGGPMAVIRGDGGEAPARDGGDVRRRELERRAPQAVSGI